MSVVPGAARSAGSETLETPQLALNLEEAQRAGQLLHSVRQEVAKSFKGNSRPTELMLVALLSRGHALVEGVPGVAKTTLAKCLAQTLGCAMKRIQFTPDLLPQDITGTYVLNPQTGSFSLRQGPIFAGIVLADEVNRAPARTQSALLEAMQEAQVTIEGESYDLPDPFLVLATQNPLDLEGTYPLPEAQIDRFLVQIELGYPTHREELSMLKAHSVRAPEARTVLTAEQCVALRDLSSRVHVEDDIFEYATNLTRFTREHPRVALGCSPRATLGLVRAARSFALLQGRPYVTPDDVRAIAPAVLGHRLVLAPELEGTPGARTSLVAEALNKVSYQHPERHIR